jgi:hypothetical protein
MSVISFMLTILIDFSWFIIHLQKKNKTFLIETYFSFCRMQSCTASYKSFVKYSRNFEKVWNYDITIFSVSVCNKLSINFLSRAEKSSNATFKKKAEDLHSIKHLTEELS